MRSQDREKNSEVKVKQQSLLSSHLRIENVVWKVSGHKVPFIMIAVGRLTKKGHFVKLSLEVEYCCLSGDRR